MSGKWSNRPRQTATVKVGEKGHATGIIRNWLGDRRVEIETPSGQRVVGVLERES